MYVGGLAVLAVPVRPRAGRVALVVAVVAVLDTVEGIPVDRHIRDDPPACAGLGAAFPGVGDEDRTERGTGVRAALVE